MGLLQPSDWTASWIEPDIPEDLKVSGPAPMLRREFRLKGDIERARAYVRNGVRVNAICPGPVTETRMSQELGEKFSALMGVSKEEQLERLFAGILQGRATTADEVAGAALFVSSQGAAITGQALNVDGGINFY